MAILDMNDGDLIFGTGNFCFDSEGNMMFGAGGNTAIDMNTGELHILSGPINDENNQLLF